MECHNSALGAVDPKLPTTAKSPWELKKQLQVCHNVLRTEFGRDCTLTGELCDICKEVIAVLTNTERVAASPEPAEQEREKFEAWMREKMPAFALMRADPAEEIGDYVAIDTTDCWMAWKASAAASRLRLERLEAENERLAAEVDGLESLRTLEYVCNASIQRAEFAETRLERLEGFLKAAGLCVECGRKFSGQHCFPEDRAALGGEVSK